MVDVATGGASSLVLGPQAERASHDSADARGGRCVRSPPLPHAANSPLAWQCGPRCAFNVFVEVLAVRSTALARAGLRE